MKTSLIVLLLILFLQLQQVHGNSFSTIKELLKSADNIKSQEDRINHFSHIFLNKSYQLGPLGEGSKGLFDRDPIFRFDAFDCTTYIETILALSLSSDSNEFLETIKAIRYSGNSITYTQRNHFPTLDWMQNGMKKKLIRDTTLNTAGNSTKTMNISSDKGKWLLSMSKKEIKCKGSGCGDSKDLVQLSKKYKSRQAKLLWIPFNHIFSKSKHGYYFNKLFIDKVPKISFFNLISVPQNNLPLIGTKIAVRHQGILLKRNGELHIRHAYIGSKKVEEIPALDFLLKSYLNKKDQKNLLGIGLSLFQAYIKKR